MKKLSIIILSFLAFSLVGSAQGLVYQAFGTGTQQSSASSEQDLIYRPFYSGHRNYQQTAPATQKVRTTAYCIKNGVYYKQPIQVEIGSGKHYGGTSYYVVALWNSSGLNESWNNLFPKAPVQLCRPLSAGGETVELEESFMYKALVGMDWFYFDL